MECEAAYAERVNVLVKEANRLENDWIVKSDENRNKATELPSQLPRSCHYRAMGWRLRGLYF